MTVRRAILPAVLPLALLAPSWWPAPGRPPPPRALQPDRHQAGHRARDGHVRLATPGGGRYWRRRPAPP